MLEMLENCAIKLWDTYVPYIHIGKFITSLKFELFTIHISIFVSLETSLQYCIHVCGVVSAYLSSSFYHYV